ncbi:hypothetical protein PIB30_031887 [Stylosanthes scabra]|uniref:Katanin p80 subunit C-terminal domain-containing protein n=1 Tax=Stylosanthes scabra TaxID=79078 RepID=A0ABU6WF10_9FABA|nr:hypothetical protein [Stylosanthes scabra]
MQSLCGHTSSVESVAFDSSEVLVLGGASSGVIKLWDLEESKMVRSVAGHSSSCTAVEFHPFGEFFASGSSDANLKLWDIRKKGCIHTYKGHSQGISTIKFTPDGRWVVSGGFDNVVKVWDLTAGKLLNDFKFHEGRICSLEFHPLEFLMATGSADRTVKFWDLESFELIGSTRQEVSGVRSIAFHPDGRTLFAGLEDSLKVYSWEPLIEPYTAGLETKNNGRAEQRLSLQASPIEKVEAGVGLTSWLHTVSPDIESKEIKNIYVDSSGGDPIALQRSRSYSSPKVDFSEESKEMLRQSPAKGASAKPNEQSVKRSFIAPNIVPRDIHGKDSAKSGNESITFSKTKPGMLLRPAHARRASTGIFDFDNVDTNSKLDSARDCNIQVKVEEPQNDVKESCEDKHPIKSVTEKFEKTLTPDRFSDTDKRVESSPCSEEITPVNINGVAVLRGRTRSLVERFERKERTPISEDQTKASLITIPERKEKNLKEDQSNVSTSPTTISERRETIPIIEDRNNTPTFPNTMSETDKSPNILKAEPQIDERASNSENEGELIEGLMQTHDVTLSNLRSRLTKIQVVRHFWDRNDSKGAINALRKLPDKSVRMTYLVQ